MQNYGNLSSLLQRVSVRTNKTPLKIQPYFQILKNNSYNSEDSLRKLTYNDYEKLKIPYCITQAIFQELNIKGNINQNMIINNNHQSNALSQQTLKKMSQIFITKLMENVNYNKEEAKLVIAVLYKILNNIAQQPYEHKYWRLKKNNNMIQRNIVQQGPCLQLLKELGFEDNGDILELNRIETQVLGFIASSLNVYINQLEGVSTHKSKFPSNETQVQQHFSQQKLAQMNYIDALENLIQIRNEMMSIPPKDRRVKIYHRQYEEKNLNIEEITFQQQFGKSNDQEIMGYWKQIVRNSVKSQNFQSKRKQQFESLIKQKIYKETLIKIRLPNQLIIQAYFAPMEELSSVYLLVNDIIEDDIYLFTTPPKKIMTKKDMDKNLYELEAVPTGSFYLSSKENNPYFIKPQFIPYILK